MAYTGMTTLTPLSSSAVVFGMVYGCVTTRFMFDAGGCLRRVSGLKKSVQLIIHFHVQREEIEYEHTELQNYCTGLVFTNNMK